ncbi:MAG: histone deacetylase [Spirochaetaceae bacterium]|jgi:acetoin utilization deacetylase AcuC-like enzyme|nr:histone deacetylase [Spirochaetaceae bacterium]
MILFDPAADAGWLDYGILIPFPADRPAKIVDFLGEAARRFPGPVLQLDQALELLGEKAPFAVEQRDVELIHASDYVEVLFQKGDDAPLTRALLDIYELIDADGKPNRYDAARAVKPMRDMFERAILGRLAGSYVAARLALEGGEGFCYYLAGGNHHARYEWGAGFCVLNDVVFTARKLQHERRAKLIWIIDVDAHKGCGSAELVDFIRRGLNPHSFEEGCGILTLSAHMARGWPLDAETLSGSLPDRAPNISSDIEIPIEAGEEALYNQKLEAGLRRLEDLSGGAACDLAIVVDGADPYEKDELASAALLALTLGQLVERGNLIYTFLSERGIKSVWLLAGGYGERAWEPAAYFLESLAAAPLATKGLT